MVDIVIGLIIVCMTICMVVDRYFEYKEKVEGEKKDDN